MGSDSSAPAAPNYNDINNAAEEAYNVSADLAKDQLEWAKNQYETEGATRDEITSFLMEGADVAAKTSADQYQWAKDQYNKDRKVSNAAVASNLDVARTDKAIAGRQQAIAAQQKGIATQNEQVAQSDRARFESTYQPVEEDLIKDYQDYNSDARRDYEMGKAQEDVGTAFEAARDASTRELESYGINPASTRYAALDLDVRTQEAAEKAAAANNASKQVEDTARELRGQVLDYGQKYQDSSQKAYNTSIAANNAATGANEGAVNANAGATSANTAAVNSQLATTASGAATMGTANEWSDNATAAATSGAATQDQNSSLVTSSANLQALPNSAVGTMSDVSAQDYKNQNAAYEQDQSSSSGIGQIAGLVAGTATKALLAADGGAVPAGASPTRGKAIDDVPAKLTAGEFVMPKDVVRWKGEEYFQKLIMASRKAKSGAAAKPTVQAIPAGRPQSALPAKVT